jgi:hypothetical protein
MLPISNAPEPTSQRPERRSRSATIATTHAPAVTVPLRFIAMSLLALAVAAGWLVSEPTLVTNYHYSPHAVAFAHLFLLGFAASAAMGIIYQLAPVAFEVPLHSQRLARLHFWCHFIGVIGMVWMFRKWDPKQVGHFGSVFGAGVILFVFNIARTFRHMPVGSLIARGITSAVGWLFVTMLVGLFLACAKCWPWITPFEPLAQMHAHAHLGVLGVFIVLTVSVAYRLVPMFTVSGIQNVRRAGWSLVLLNAGVAGLTATILLRSPWKLAFALLTVTGLAFFAVELSAILRARQRQALDWGVRYFLTGAILLAPLSFLAIVLCWPGLPVTHFTQQLENAYAIIALLGVLGFAITGMLYKILPFLIWFHRYSNDVGRTRVPALADMLSPRLQAVGYGMHLGGVLIAAAASVLGHTRCATVAGTLIAASVLLLGINAIYIVSHLLRRSGSAPIVPLHPAHAHA